MVVGASTRLKQPSAFHGTGGARQFKGAPGIFGWLGQCDASQEGGRHSSTGRQLSGKCSFGFDPHALQVTDPVLRRQPTFSFNPRVADFFPRGGPVAAAQSAGELVRPAGDEVEGEENVLRSDSEDEVECLDEGGSGEARQRALGSARGDPDAEGEVRDPPPPVVVDPPPPVVVDPPPPAAAEAGGDQAGPQVRGGGGLDDANSPYF